MKVAILTNDDLTGSLIFSPVLTLTSISVAVIVFSKSPIKGRKSLLSAAWALRSKMAFRYWLFLVVSNGLFRLFSLIATTLRLPGNFGDLDSLPAHARRCEIPTHTCPDFNSAELKLLLHELEIDLLLVRMSTILDAEVLSIPLKGTWCIHSSLLPAFSGIAGEFQALRTGCKTLGSTVFEVTEKLDEGPPLAQIEIPTREDRSLFAHVFANNRAAGQLVARMVADLGADRCPRRPLLSAGLQPSYFSWPKEEEVAEFRRKGFQLISFGEIVRLGLSAVRLGRSIARFS